MKVMVTLTPDEIRTAGHAGVERRIRAMRKNRQPNQPERPDWQQHWWESDIQGCIAEMAVCKAFGVDFIDLENDIDGDVLGYQVRSVQNPKAGLRVRTHDAMNHVYILAQVHRNKVLLHGYMSGWQVRERGFEEFPQCYTMPKDELYSMTDLPHPIEWSTSVLAYEPMPIV